MKSGILGRSSPLHPVSSPPCLPWPPASLRRIQYPNLLLITEKIVEEEESEEEAAQEERRKKPNPGSERCYKVIVTNENGLQAANPNR